MRILYFYRKRVIVLFLILIVIGMIVTGIFSIGRLTQNKKIDNEVYEVIKMTEEEESASQKESVQEAFVTGKDILAQYSEVKDTDYAILVATTPFLEADSDLIAAETEYPYIKYVIDENHQHIAETIQDSNNEEVILSLVNYNAVLKDGCIFHKEGSNIYETPYGFMEEDIIVEGLNESEIVENITYLAVFPLKNSKKNINYINEDSLFSEAYLVDLNSKVVGSIYIELRGTH